MDEPLNVEDLMKATEILSALPENRIDLAEWVGLPDDHPAIPVIWAAMEYKWQASKQLTAKDERIRELETQLQTQGRALDEADQCICENRHAVPCHDQECVERKARLNTSPTPPAPDTPPQS